MKTLTPAPGDLLYCKLHSTSAVSCVLQHESWYSEIERELNDLPLDSEHRCRTSARVERQETELIIDGEIVQSDAAIELRRS